MALSSFSTASGGDLFTIYLNGRQMHRQFIHIDQSVKTLQLQSFNDNDKIEVLYSHCGNTGKNRVLTLRNEKNELIKEIKFTNSYNKNTLMGFCRKDIGKVMNGELNLWYSSIELPGGKLLATIIWREREVKANP
jgi:hypothetical protein